MLSAKNRITITAVLLLMYQFDYSFGISSSVAALEETIEGKENASIPIVTTNPTQNTEYRYGVDVSFPMHSAKVSTNYDWLPHNIDPLQNLPPNELVGMPVQKLGNRQEFYENYMQGCRDHWKEDPLICDRNEQDRIVQSLLQPRYMVNYTETGYKKIRAPENLFQLIKNFWEKNRYNETKESWYTGNVFTNYWETPSAFVNVYSDDYEEGGYQLADAIADATRDIIQEWTGQELVSTSVYGIRVYKNGSVLSPHVDRLPLISSCIINVDQDVNEPWPLEVIGHDGIARNVTMLPGDLVLYESHSVLHGRPFPLNGTFFANIFIHFAPVSSMTEEEESNGKRKLPAYINPNDPLAEKWYRSTMKEEAESDDEEEETIEHSGDGDETGEHFENDQEGELQEHDNYYGEVEGNELYEEDELYYGGADVDNNPDQMGLDETYEAHVAAGEGDLSTLQRIALENSNALNQEDRNGWRPIHEAARSLLLDTVKFLIEHGADIHAKTNDGMEPYHVAQYYGGDNNPVAEFLHHYDDKDDFESEL